MLNELNLKDIVRLRFGKKRSKQESRASENCKEALKQRDLEVFKVNKKFITPPKQYKDSINYS